VFVFGTEYEYEYENETEYDYEYENLWPLLEPGD